MSPATVPYTAAFIESPPRPPKTSSTTESADQRADRDRPLVVGRVLLPAGRVTEVDEQAEPEDDHERADHLASAHVLLRQEVAEREREHHRGDEQRLDDREAAAVECARLEEIPGEQGDRAEEPHLLADQPHERHRVGERDRREVQRTLLLEGRREGEEECRDERQGSSHA